MKYTHFRLIGRTTRFRVYRRFTDEIGSAVVGRTEDGKFQTVCRASDLIPLTGLSPKGTAALRMMQGH